MLTMRTERAPIRFGPTIVIVAAVIAIALFGGLATDTTSAWYMNLAKPAWQPPAWLFGPVWTLLYLLLALSAIIVWHHTSGDTRRSLMTLYAINGILNLAWTFIFFQGHAPVWAGVEIIVLWLTIALMMARTRPISHAASLMLLPYLLWVGFASILTWAIAGGGA
jgi:tryptophan-rich sensory protein